MAEVTTRQKVVAVAVILVVIVLIWQVMELFRGPTSPQIKPVAQKNVTVTSTTSQITQANPNAPVTVVPPQTTIQAKPVPAILTPEIQRLEQTSQLNYLSSINNLQQLKIQQQIAETTQAIAKAKLEEVTAQKKITDLLSKPAPSLQPPPGDYSKATGPGAAAPGAPPTTTPIPPPPSSSEEAPVLAPYSVISVSMIHGKWSAVMGYQGKLYNVSVGDILPMDGSVVAFIDRSGVVLRSGSSRRKISLLSSI